ncbi:MAG: hypothetical protein ACRDN6_12345 [Gaiellaceae bacterium]
MTREEIAARVDALQAAGDFVAALGRFAAELDDDDRALLQEVLLERADYDHALRARIDERGWLRRQWDSADRARRRPDDA